MSDRVQFLEIDDRLINVAYIKEISPEALIIANTEAISYSKSSESGFRFVQSHVQSDVQIMDDQIVKLTEEQYKYVVEQLSFPKKMEQLKAENERLKTHLEFRPGGEGYHSAKTSFEYRQLEEIN